tara:strand:- start:47 stop:442 length:396 start_codon:yes stop_codon:yes gene_type:complete
VEGGQSWWNRSDIAYCEYDFEYNLTTLNTALSYCGVGWHGCTSAEFTQRNDNFVNLHGSSLTGRLNDGDDCYAHDNYNPDAAHNWSSDGVRATYPGSCTGTTSAASFGRQSQIENGLCAGAYGCGVLCCLD